ncbi:Glycosyl-phosphatidyl inositol-anchored, plant [Corchorus olitorius]|uniref:Glycosyl-phosphatidyl inositol-anchored, plant n=1 Tax=Corchorus olitorius TaxID=93759 RepID=A0A1R3IHF9_9ROSI|nr:Glycosyl-phosphatidyl inositol-anchored, plant [Corchorus olitorius]
MAGCKLHHTFIFTFLLLSVSFFHTSLSQSQTPTPAPAPAPASDSCNGVFLSYTYTRGNPIPPTDPTNQAYRFESTLVVLNNGRHELKSWRAFVGFRHKELLVSASNAILADGSSLPAEVGGGAVFAGFPMADLKSAVETAGDRTQMEVRVELVGTQYGVGAPNVPMPLNISLVNDGYACYNATNTGNNEMHVCCIQDRNSDTNNGLNEEFLPRQEGDLIIMYDVIRAYDDNYWAQVSISNHNPLGRLDNWQLSFDWMREEFIFAMKGAYPLVVDTSECVFGRQGQHYKGMDFSQALNCERRPTIIDLPPTRANDTNLGRIPFCCRNGTILPPSMDPSKSKSSFQMQVYKMPPDLNRTELASPQNWKINGGAMNPDYQCGNPIQVSPSQFPDPSGLPSETAAIVSWQVVCNITQSKKETPKCCVSYSAFFNESAIPCNTCACGCNSNPSETCSATEPALLLRPDSLLIPFENRSAEAKEWANIHKRTLPNPLPCGDNCGVSINWHLVSDYKDGWSARITIFNWGETNFEDWFAAVQLDKAIAGFEGVYSFNGSVPDGSNNTIFMYGHPGNNFLLAETDGANPKKDPRVPGTQQSVISFKKKLTPGIKVAEGDGFPTKVLFNGEECSLPIILPSKASRAGAATSIFGFLTLALLLLMQR